MPFVPYSPVPAVLPQGQIAPQRIEASPADFGAQAGQALQQDSGELWQQALQKQMLSNETAVNDTINNKFFPAFQDQYQKYYSLQGKDAVDQLQNYQQSMRDMAQQFRSGLANQMQQRLFDQEANRRMQIEFAGMGRYADQQNKVYQAQTSAATVDRAINLGADKYNDPLALQGAAISASNEVARYGALTGQSAEVINERTEQAFDKLFATVIERQLQDPSMGPQAANKTYQAAVKAGYLSGAAELQIGRVLKSSLQVADASTFVDGLLGAGPKPQIGPGTDSNPVGWKPGEGKSIEQEQNAVTNAIALRESNNKADAPNTDANGIPGRFQFQKATWAKMSSDYNQAVNGKTGVLDPNDANQTAVATWQIGQWLKAGYSPAQVAAMWNSSHADWAGRAGTNATGKNYDVPGYVSSVVGNYERLSGSPLPMVADASGATVPVATTQGGAGAPLLQPSQPPPGGWSAQQIAAQRLEWENEIVKRYPDNPQAQRQALSILDSKINMMEGPLKLQTYADENTIYQAITDPKGPMTLSDAMKDPKFVAAWDRFGQTNAKIRESFLEAFANKPALMYKVIPPTQQQNDRYYELLGEVGLDPQKFVDMPMGQENLPQPMIDKLRTVQNGLRIRLTTAESREETKNLNMDAAMKVAKVPLQIAGIDPSSANGKAQYKAFYGRLAQWLGEFQANNKRGPKTPELMDGINALLTQVKVPGSYYGTNSEYGYQLSGEQENHAHIPPAMIPSASARFQAHYGRPPLSQELDAAYFATKFHPGNVALQNQIDKQIQLNSQLIKQGKNPTVANTGAAQVPGLYPHYLGDLFNKYWEAGERQMEKNRSVGYLPVGQLVPGSGE